MASNEAINSEDVRQTPARHGFGGRRGKEYSRKKYTRDWSSNGPPLFLIYWPDIKLGGPAGPVKDTMLWSVLARRSEECAGPTGQCLC